MRKLRKKYISKTKYPKFFIEGELAMLEPSFNLLIKDNHVLQKRKRG